MVVDGRDEFIVVSSVRNKHLLLRQQCYLPHSSCRMRDCIAMVVTAWEMAVDRVTRSGSTEHR